MSPTRPRADKIHNARSDYCTCPMCTRNRARAFRAEPATDDQITWIESFLTHRNLYLGHFDRLWKLLEMHRLNERDRSDGSPISREHADRIVGWLYRKHGAGSGQPQPQLWNGGAVLGNPGCRHHADRNGNCVTCGAEMFDPSLAR